LSLHPGIFPRSKKKRQKWRSEKAFWLGYFLRRTSHGGASRQYCCLS
jgi:hypothetical protein